MIESFFWKQDLQKYVKKFKPVVKPPRFSEKGVVNFEKDLILCFFMIRKLIETHKVSSKTKSHRATVFRCPSVKRVDNRNYSWIEDLYDFEHEQAVQKDIKFICNQLIHCGAIYAYRQEDRNWGGVYVCSDKERKEFVYRLPLSELIDIMDIVSTDYPKKMSITFCEKMDDYRIKTD